MLAVVCGVCVCARARESVCVRRVGPVLPLHSCLLWCVVCLRVSVCERKCVRRVGVCIAALFVLAVCVLLCVCVCVRECVYAS